MNSNTIKVRLSELRLFMQMHNLDAFIIPSTDPHLSEYPAVCWESRVWISGFTGSAGTIVVTKDRSGLWTDSRYFIQAESQLSGTTIELYKEGISDTPSIAEWLSEQLHVGATVGIDALVYSAREALILKQTLAKANIDLNSEYDPFSTIWTDRPSIPVNNLFILPEQYTGESAKSKIDRVCKALDRKGADSLLVASLDTTAWLFNIRGNDVAFNPVGICYAYISKNESVLFVNPLKLTKEVSTYLAEQNIIIAEYNKVFDFIAKRKETICLDSNKINLKLFDSIDTDSCKIVDIPSPADLMKACKNDIELDGFRRAMLKDGVALVQFFMWLDSNIKQGYIKETDIENKLIEYRSKQNLFVGPSFNTIAGYAGNGAIVHYHATTEHALTIESKGLLLIDSGGQYFDGTTDITRTVAVGELTEQMKEDYTLVLKGHIAIARAIYPKGTRGAQLDILARQFLWREGLNYLHGTGHGIGHFLNVHEGPQNIRLNENPTPLEIGMVTSNEPGIYRSEQYGIRLENLIVTRKEKSSEFGDFYSFETITLCPFDIKPIKKELLTQDEIDWLNDYHKYVFEKLSPLLNEEELNWLKNKTHEI